MANRLIHETSPYLRQHAHNPVDWHPWGSEAFELARATNRPILLSIGYAACHWCHVMERESFEDEAVAAVLNAHFVPIKVDREERPAVDAIYIEALQHMQGHAGWPANLFLRPDLTPFAGATYLPPEPRRGQPSFTQVLERIHQLWAADPDRIDQVAGMLLTALDSSVEPTAEAPTQAVYATSVAAFAELHDRAHGGLGTGQKFPQTPVYELLLLAAADNLPGAHVVVEHSLDAMARRGLRDHLGGGFHRYCVDRAWTVPHFEKMLYDNAQLLRVYARAASLWRERRASMADAWVNVCRDTVSYLMRDLRHPDGGFMASEDADDPGGEGHFYTFTPSEAREVLGDDAPLPYGITDAGNFEEGRTVLHVERHWPVPRVRYALQEARNQRPRPPLDDKRVVAWNGLTVGALAEAGRLLGFDDWISAAAATAELLLAARDAQGLLPRLLGSDMAGTLTDQAFVADGLIDLYQARPHEIRWLDAAVDIAKATIEHLGAPGGGFYEAPDRDDLIVRKKPMLDGAEPSGNGRMAQVLARLGMYGVDLGTVLEDTLQAASGWMGVAPRGVPELAAVLRSIAGPPDSAPQEVVLAGNPDDPRLQQMLRRYNQRWRPWSVVAVLPPGSDAAERFALFEGRVPAAGDAPRAYVCRRGACQLPVTSASEMGLEG